MDAAFIHALQAAKNPEDKAALIAEASLSLFSDGVARVARQCVLFHWFDQSLVEGLLSTLLLNTESAQDVYRQITSLPFVEQLPWGAAYQDLTRQGLLKYYAHIQTELLKSAAHVAAPLYRATSIEENDRNAAEALFCSIVSSDTLASSLYLTRLLEQAMSRQDWQQMEGLFRLQEEAEQLSFVEPIPRTEQYWMLRSIVDRTRGQLDEAIHDYDRALALNPNNALAYLNRSILFMQQQRHEQAIVDYREALRLDPSLVRVYVDSEIVSPLHERASNIPEPALSEQVISRPVPTVKTSQPIKLFYCYVSKDRALRDELDIHLAVLRRSGLITSWYAGELIPGISREQEIETRIDTADIILLLVSPDFIRSSYYYSNEMQRAIERHHANQARVIPILLRPVDWTDTPFAQLQMLPSDAQPITLWSNRDAAFEDIARGIRRIVIHLMHQTKAEEEVLVPFPQLVNKPTPYTATPLKAAPRTATPHHFSRRRFLRRLLIGGGGLVAGLALIGVITNLIKRPSPSHGLLLYTYIGHTGGVETVKSSPNGLRIASAGLDRTVQVWDALTGEAAIIYRSHTKAVNGVAWSPDGKRIASGSADHTVHVWNAIHGDNLFIFTQHTSDVHDVSWSPDGKRIASASKDSTVAVFDATSGQPFYIYKGHTEEVVSVSWSPDGKLIASGGLDGQIHVWDALNGVTLFAPVNTQNTVVETVAWSPNGKYIAVGGDNQRVEVMNTTGNTVYVYAGHTDVVRRVVWSPDGNQIASASFDDSVHVWDAFSGSHSFIYRGHRGWVVGLDQASNGKYIASGSYDKTVQVWDVSST